jgi:hypothetical protein
VTKGVGRSGAAAPSGHSPKGGAASVSTADAASIPNTTLYIFDEREPVWKSAARDAISFGGLVGSAIALNTLMPPSAWLNAALAICWILWLAGKGLKRRMTKTPAEAMAWLRSEYPAAVSETGDAQ